MRYKVLWSSTLFCSQTSLQFPDDVAISDDARNLIYQLLVESTHRLQYSAITGHIKLIDFGSATRVDKNSKVVSPCMLVC